MLFVRLTPGVNPMDRYHLEQRALDVIPKTATPSIMGGGTMLVKPFTSDFQIALTLSGDLFPTIMDAVKAAVLAEVPAGTEVTVERAPTRVLRPSRRSSQRKRAQRK